MRVAVVADSHYDEGKRFEETKRLHAWIAADARARGCTATLHCGDVYEKKSSPLERDAASDFFQEVAGFGPVVIVRGNHDAVDDLPLLTKLDTDWPITVVETSAIVELNGITVAAVAWPRKAALLAATGAEGRDDSEALAAEALRDMLRGLGSELASETGPTALVMHAMIRDSVTSTGQPLVGCDFEIGIDDLSLVGADAYFVGHVHMQQHWLIGSAPCIYPGSPRRCNFGETEPKGYVVAEWDDATAELVGWEFVEAPATPMYHVDDEWGAEGWLAGAHGLPESCAGAELRFRYRVRSDQRQAARAAAEAWRDAWLAEGAISVKLDEQVILEHRSRAEAIPTKATLAEKLEAFWAAKHFEPGERRTALLAKVQLIQEARHAA